MKRRGSMMFKVSFMALGVGFALWRGSAFLGQIEALQSEGGLGALGGLGSLSELGSGLSGLGAAEEGARAESEPEFVVYTASGETIDAASAGDSQKLLAHAKQLRPKVPSERTARNKDSDDPHRDSVIRVRKAQKPTDTEDSGMAELESVLGLLEGLAPAKK